MKVSIIIRAYNAEETLRRAVESVLHQNFPPSDFEIIVVNDGSTDRTGEILEVYEGNPNLKVISQENQGAVKAANVGFKKARGEYVVLLDGDDKFEPDFLKEACAVLDLQPDVAFVYCDYYERKIDGSVVMILTDNLFNTGESAVLFRKNLLQKAGYYNENVKFPEYDLLLRTINIWEGVRIPKPLLYYYRRPSALTGRKEWVLEGLEELKKKYPDRLREISKIRSY